MDNKILFLKTLDDIRNRLESHDEYEILIIDGLLAKLLLDGDSLIKIVNTELKLKIYFIINDRMPPNHPDLAFWSLQDGLDPDNSPPSSIKPLKLNLEQFLKRPILMNQGKIFTIYEVISYLRNVGGAVHSGIPKDEQQNFLREVQETFNIGGISPLIRTTLAIARVALKGLLPLEEAIKNNYSK